jgi:transposase
MGRSPKGNLRLYHSVQERFSPDAYDYHGFLQADAANVFDGIYRPGAIVEVGCWAHTRRYFYEARDTDAARSAEALTRIRDFYRIEEEARDRSTRERLASDAADGLRRQLRQERTAPKLAAFRTWLDDQIPRVLPKSPIGHAFAYARRQWAALLRFTEHDFLNIDNNASFAPSPWAARIGSSRAAMPAASPRRCCTR